MICIFRQIWQFWVLWVCFRVFKCFHSFDWHDSVFGWFSLWFFCQWMRWLCFGCFERLILTGVCLRTEIIFISLAPYFTDFEHHFFWESNYYGVINLNKNFDQSSGQFDKKRKWWQFWKFWGRGRRGNFGAWRILTVIRGCFDSFDSFESEGGGSSVVSTDLTSGNLSVLTNLTVMTVLREGVLGL